MNANIQLDGLRTWEKRTHNLLDNEVSVYGRTIAVSSNLCKHLNKYVELLFDPNHHIVAIKPTDQKTRHTYNVQEPRQKDRRELTKSFAPYSMIKQLKIKRLRYHAEWIPEKGLIVFEYEVLNNADL